MRVATFNVRHGLADDGRTDPARLARAVAALDADVVALQEVDRGQTRSGGVDQVRAVAAAAGAVDRRYVPALAGPLDPWPARRRARGDEPDDVPGYGVALLSRHPVTAWHRLRLPLGALPLPGGRQAGLDEPRVALAAVVATPHGPLTVVTTHLSAWRRWNRWQLRYLRHALRHAPRPLVLLGDLNLRDDVPAALTGWRPLAVVPTYPLDVPRLQIDHVLGDGPVRAAGAARAVHTGLSDHRAVVVDLDLGPGRHDARTTAGRSRSSRRDRSST